MYMNDLRDNKGGKLETLDDFYHKEMQSRAFNPKWIEAMMKDDYSGAHYMQNITENLWAFNVTSPNTVHDADWKEMNDVFIKDKYGLGLKDFFEKANPYAKQTMLSTMLGAAEKGYWKADKETLAQLSKALAESVAKNGAGCSSVICNTATIQNFTVHNLLTVPGGASLVQGYAQGIARQTTGLSLAPSASAPVNTITVPTVIKRMLTKALKRAAPVKSTLRPVGNTAPAGKAVQGNEVVTTSVKKLSGPTVQNSNTKPAGNLLYAAIVLLLFFCIGWASESRRRKEA